MLSVLRMFSIINKYVDDIKKKNSEIKKEGIMDDKEYFVLFKWKVRPNRSFAQG